MYLVDPMARLHRRVRRRRRRRRRDVVTTSYQAEPEHHHRHHRQQQQAAYQSRKSAKTRLVTVSYRRYHRVHFSIRSIPKHPADDRSLSREHRGVSPAQWAPQIKVFQARRFFGFETDRRKARASTPLPKCQFLKNFG